jgi:hypothetical protein
MLRQVHRIRSVVPLHACMRIAGHA